MVSFSDAITSVLRSTLRFAGAHYPLRILGGLSGGIVLNAILEVIATAITSDLLQAAADLHVVYSCALGIFVVVLSTLMSGSQLDEETIRALSLIERIIDRPELGELDRRMAWRSVLTKAVEAFRPGGVQALEAGRLAEEAVRETKESS